MKKRRGEAGGQLTLAEAAGDDDPARMPAHPVTPDGRYFVVRGRLWRCSNPELTDADRKALVDELMSARRAVRTALATKDSDELAAARARVDVAKRGLGERGPVWWLDGSPDLNRRMVAKTPYADWHAALTPGDGTTG